MAAFPIIFFIYRRISNRFFGSGLIECGVEKTSLSIKKDIDQWYVFPGKGPPEFLSVSEKRLAREQIHLSKKKHRLKNRNTQRIIVS